MLILGASGGVGTCCVQLAKSLGCEVIACASSAWKIERLKQLGADHVIDTSTQNYVAEIHRLYGKPRTRGGGGVDVIINYTGGETWAECFRALKLHGTAADLRRHGGLRPEDRYPLHLVLRVQHHRLQRLDRRGPAGAAAACRRGPGQADRARHPSPRGAAAARRRGRADLRGVPRQGGRHRRRAWSSRAATRATCSSTWARWRRCCRRRSRCRASGTCTATRIRCYVVARPQGVRGPVGHAVAHPPEPGQEAVRAGGARDRRRHGRDRRASPARPATAPRSPCGRTGPGSTPRAPASARWAAGSAA